jgi:hypothetical protein
MAGFAMGLATPVRSNYTADQLQTKDAAFMRQNGLSNRVFRCFAGWPRRALGVRPRCRAETHMQRTSGIGWTMAAQIISLTSQAEHPEGGRAIDQQLENAGNLQRQFVDGLSKLVGQDYLPLVRAGPVALTAAAFALLRATRSVSGCLPLPQRDLQIAIARALLAEAGEQRLDQEEDIADVGGGIIS